MKGQLYIGDEMVAETVEVVSPPQSGDLVIYQGKRLRVREIAHNIEKKKLQIMCHVPPPVNVTHEPAPETSVDDEDDDEMFDRSGEDSGMDLDRE